MLPLSCLARLGKDDGMDEDQDSELAPASLPPAATGVNDVDEDWLEVDAAARYLSVPRAVIYRLIDDGMLPARRSPTLIRPRDLDDCVERCRIRPSQLAHLNQYAGHKQVRRQPQPRLTAKGVPDRRYGPR